MTARDTNGAKLSLASDAEAPDHPDIAAGRAVLTTEADALTALAATLDARFVAALDILDDVAREDRNGQHPPGRVIVSGMGKSGHIGRKIAATLASTGTPAQFVHPAEASHGDLGMITERDAVIALSNSGETQELSDLIRHVTRFGIPLISITGRGDSTLARAATVPLVLPDYPEAGALGLAPTTSTTMTLALGDALAVALLERKGFTAADFRILHPGGKLGHQLSMVGDLMHRGDELPLVPDTARMPEAMLAMTSKHFGCTGVVSADGVLAGIITDGDLRRHMSPELTTLPVTQVMTARPVTLGANTMAAEALKLMNGRQITAAFVVDDAERPVGIVHIHDFLRSGVA